MVCASLCGGARCGLVGDDEDVGGERATKGDGVSVRVLVRPDGADAFYDGVVCGVEAFTGTVEGEGHGFDTGLGGDEEEPRENRRADFCCTKNKEG